MIRSSERGSAVVLAMVIVIIVVGVSGAFLAESLIRSKVQYSANQADEAQMICDAVLEKTRRALWLYRATEKGAPGGNTAFTWAWNDILQYCQNLPALSNPTATCWVNTTEVNPTYVWRSYQSAVSQQFFISYLAALGGTSLDQTTMTGSINTTPGSPTTPSPSGDGNYSGSFSSDAVFIGWSRPFGRGAYFVVIRDNEDEAGTNDPLVDTDNTIVVHITATLPEGTQRSIEALVEYPEAYFDPQAGLLSDGDVDMGNGNVTSPSTVTSGGGKVHTNGDLLVGATGNATSVNAVGEVTGPGGGAPPSSAGTVNDATTGTPPAVLPIPDVVASSFLTNPLYNNGTTVPMYWIEKGSGNSIAIYTVTSSGAKGSAVTSSTITGAWSFQNGGGSNPDTAKLTTAAASVQAVWYSPTMNFDLNPPGNSSISVTGTFITAESVTMGGNSSVSPFVKQMDTSVDPPVVKAATTVVAQKDLTISGTSSSLVQEGIFLAGEQASLNGTVSVQGSVIAKDNANSNGGGNVANSYGAAVVGNGSTVSYTKVKSLIPLGEDAVKVKNVRRMGMNK